jgi:hypothetical protein
VAVVVAMVEADLLLPAVVVTVEAGLPSAVVDLLLPRVEVVSLAVGLPWVVATVEAGLPPAVVVTVEADLLSAVVGLLLPRVEVVSLAVGLVQGQCGFGRRRRRWQGISRARKKGPEATASSCCQAQ